MKTALFALLVGCGGAKPVPAPAATAAPSPIAISNSAAKDEPTSNGSKITGIEPAKGDVDGGTYAKLAGVRLLPIAQSAKIYFGTREGEIVRIASDSELVVQAPGGKAGETVDILVVFEGGEIKLPKAFTFVEKKP